MSDDLPTLWQIDVSHYSEKARWALAWKGVEHRRRSPVPGAHMAVALWLTRGAQYTFPVLSIEGRRIGDSTAIVAALEELYPEPPLYPADIAQRRRALRARGVLRRGARPLRPAARLVRVRQRPGELCGVDGTDRPQAAGQVRPTDRRLRPRLHGASLPPAMPRRPNGRGQRLWPPSTGWRPSWGIGSTWSTSASASLTSPRPRSSTRWRSPRRPHSRPTRPPQRASNASASRCWSGAASSG